MNYLPHLFALIMCCIVLWVIKRKFKRIRTRELIIVFILFVILIAIFTEQGMDLIKKLINLIQIE
jgi:dolichyl-phosphate-mannose--protein O-mannosyl transferase